MNSLYRSAVGRDRIRRWCAGQLDAWPVPHQRATVTAHGASTHAVTAGSGKPVVFVPGTNFNAAASLPLATALVSAGHSVTLLDVPGQPGLSTDGRDISRGAMSWYGTWLDEAIHELHETPVTVMGHSFGAAIALSGRSPLIGARVLVSPAGMTRLRVTPRLLATSAAWYLRPTPDRSRRLLRAMMAPGAGQPREALVEWMTLVARHTRSSGAPSTVPPSSPEPCVFISGARDAFLPPTRLARAVRTRFDAVLHTVDDTGHLIVEERPDHLADLLTPRT
ncbi:alpha/beta fold hydrolase [Streptomyces sp. NPDC020965]|uniref:alpha/beta fold hydrolase n=1 Tax=Streptomyces sp. NPDC020965 TaxID=3365105 RepID=UPI0037B1DE7E